MSIFIVFRPRPTFSLSIRTNDSDDLYVYPVRPIALMDSSPFFLHSEYPAIAQQDLVVSFPTMLAMSGGRIRSIYDIEMRAYLIETSSSGKSSSSRRRILVRSEQVLFVK